jgi:glycosyltransferase involved in cell wall biosynthesis
VDLLSLVHDADEAAQAGGRIPARRVTVVRTTPWRNRVRSAMTLPTARPLTHGLLDSPGLEAALADVVRSSKPDVVLAYCTGMARLGLAECLKDVPMVLDMVDVDSAKWRALSRTTLPPLGWVYGREARCLGQFESKIVGHARTTLVVNERERETLAQAMPRADVRIVPNGIDLEQFSPRSAPASEPRVVFCGVMNYPPNEEAALRLVKQICTIVLAERHDGGLVIVGGL